ncbi:MAG: hypothetical protein Q8N08_08475, partial [Methanobacteriaceae archaeon]|nr:hypothetical protein [Methanobacteriaceae archaeon]
MTENKQPININISTSTIIKVISIFLLLYFVYLIKDVLAILFIALIFSSALDPWFDWMQSKKFPRAAWILLIYFILFIII